MIPSLRTARPKPHNLTPRPLTLIPRVNRINTPPGTYRTLTSETESKEHSPKRLPKRLPAEPLRILFCGSDRFSAPTLAYLNKERLETQQRRTGTPVGIWNGSGLDTVKVTAGYEELLGHGGRGFGGVDVDSIDVVVKSVKATGRGRKGDNKSMVEQMANGMGLRVHHIDTFTGWEPPRNINLIIAVSFGLLVPPRLLKAAKFGGLNIHPSLLPDLRGPAPIHHAILKGYTHTGVTVQTLHPSKFDHGTILSQTNREKLYELKPETSIFEHSHQLGWWGQRALQWVLERGVYRLEHVLDGDPEKQGVTVNENGDKAGWYERVVEAEGGVVNVAPKVDSGDHNIVWAGQRRWLGTHFERAGRVFSNLWTVLQQNKKGARGREQGPMMRVVLHDVKVVDAARVKELEEGMKSEKEEGGKNAEEEEGKREEGNTLRRGYIWASDIVRKNGLGIPVRIIGEAVYIRIEDGAKWVEVREVTVAGKPRRPAAQALERDFVKG